MKKKMLLISLFWSFYSLASLVRIGPFPGMTDTELSTTEDTQFTVTSEIKGNCDFAQQIIQSQSIPTTPFLSPNPPFRITIPGLYCVATNISVPSGTTAIIIETDNVLIDLADMCIKGQPNSGIGILVTGNNRRNITIRNGSIFTMGGNAIQMNNGGEQIIFENLKLCRNNIGMSLFGIQDFIINNCLITFNRSHGILMNQFGTVLTQNGIINNCISSFNNLNGIQLSACANMQISNVNGSNNGNSGFNIVNGTCLEFENCQAESNTINGFFSSGSSFSFSQCIANTNRGVGIWATGNRLNLNECQAKGNLLDGFRLSGNNNVVTNATSTNNTQIGFNISGNQHSYEQCTALANNTGFQIANANHCILQCVAKLNTTFGFLLQANSTQCQVRSNTAVSNGTAGFQNNTTTVNRIYSNFANNNGTPPAAASNFVGIPNVFTSPVPADAINFTTNISN